MILELQRVNDVIFFIPYKTYYYYNYCYLLLYFTKLFFVYYSERARTRDRIRKHAPNNSTSKQTYLSTQYIQIIGSSLISNYTYLLPIVDQCAMRLQKNWKLVAFKNRRVFLYEFFFFSFLKLSSLIFFFNKILFFFCTSTPAIIHSEDGNLYYTLFFRARLFVVCFYFLFVFISLSISKKYLLWKKYSCQICFS